MARKVECGKFKVIECDSLEMMDLGSLGICDLCGDLPSYGYLVSVLNKWLCPECYEKWKKRAVWFPEDAEYEERKFNFYSQLLGVTA